MDATGLAHELLSFSRSLLLRALLQRTTSGRGRLTGVGHHGNESENFIDLFSLSVSQPRHAACSRARRTPGTASEPESLGPGRGRCPSRLTPGRRAACSDGNNYGNQ